MPHRRNNPNNAFVRKAGQDQGRPDDMNRMQIEPAPGVEGPPPVDATEPGQQGRFSDRIKYDMFGGVDKATMRPKDKIKRA